MAKLWEPPRDAVICTLNTIREYKDGVPFMTLLGVMQNRGFDFQTRHIRILLRHLQETGHVWPVTNNKTNLVRYTSRSPDADKPKNGIEWMVREIEKCVA